MKRIGVITGSRSDYGIYRPILEEIVLQSSLHLHLFVTGMHLSPEFGMTINAIEEDGFNIDEQIEMLLSSDSPTGIATSIGIGTVGFAQAFAKSHVDLLLVLGDRYEMCAGAIAALPFRMPIAHIHGGEITEGAIDESIRHAITKMSHLHFVSTEVYARRIIQMGEEPWRVTVSGAPSLDNILKLTLLNRRELALKSGLDVENPFLLLTYHPVTLEPDLIQFQVGELLAALKEVDIPIIATYPNADLGNHSVRQMMHAFAEQPQVHLVDNLGTQYYFSLMKYATAMIGNSSSGIIEAASFKLPVVNIGTRQNGRLRANNVIDVDNDRDAISAALKTAMSSPFRRHLTDLVNPYGDGHAARRSVEKLKQIPLKDILLRKRFYDIDVASTVYSQTPHRVCPPTLKPKSVVHTNGAI
jgi:UDP-hydrolysing UDP-N-acetyl-D-glucosamine 2-epimerase